MRNSYAPLVWQCRYSGIEVPDALWRYVEFGQGVSYSENQAEDMVEQPEVLRAFDTWTDEFTRHVTTKGKVPPGRYRAYGYEPPSHFLADLRTKWRGLRMALGRPVPGTSPAIQQELGLNRGRHDSLQARRRRKAPRLIPARPPPRRHLRAVPSLLRDAEAGRHRGSRSRRHCRRS
jgi:hypothetical protein